MRLVPLSMCSIRLSFYASLPVILMLDTQLYIFLDENRVGSHSLGVWLCPISSKGQAYSFGVCVSSGLI